MTCDPNPITSALLLPLALFAHCWRHRFDPHPWYGSRAFDWRAFDLDPANRKALRKFVRHGGALASGLSLESIERGLSHELLGSFSSL